MLLGSSAPGFTYAISKAPDDELYQCGLILAHEPEPFDGIDEANN
jgi:hypothetical protein